MIHPWNPICTNGLGALHTLRAAIPYLTSDAHVLLCSSTWGSMFRQAITSGEAAYATTKAMLTRMATGITLGDNKKLVVLSPDYVISDMILTAMFRGQDERPNLQIPVNAETVEEMRPMFANVPRDYLVHQMQSVALPDLLFDPSTIAPGKELYDYFFDTVAGLSSGFYSHPLKTGYLISKSLREGLDHAELVFTNPGYKTWLADRLGQKNTLPDGQPDTTALDALQFGESGNLFPVLADESIRSFATLLANTGFRRIAA